LLLLLLALLLLFAVGDLVFVAALLSKNSIP
jgi:hypothetical protein